ncbi:MAG: hypothetical protein R3F59_17640 [Myxococcota bacterium]
MTWQFVLALANGAPAAEPLRIDVAVGGLANASLVLQARTGTSINYEGVPRNVEGRHYRWDSLPNGDPVVRPMRNGSLSVAYAADATPLEALEVLVAAANSSPESCALYRIQRTGTSLDLVPTHILTDGGMVPYSSIMDTIITLPSAVGDAEALYQSVVETLSSTVGIPIVDMAPNHALNDCSSPPLTLTSATGTARALLDQIFSQSTYANHWRLAYLSPGHQQEGWFMSFAIIRPEMDAILSRPHRAEPAHDQRGIVEMEDTPLRR